MESFTKASDRLKGLVSKGAVLLYGEIVSAINMNERFGREVPSLADMGRRIDVGRVQAARLLKELKNVGVVEVIPICGRPHGYRLLDPWSPAPAIEGATSYKNVAGPDDGTSIKNVAGTSYIFDTGTSYKNVAGPENPPIEGFKILKREEDQTDPSPVESQIPKPPKTVARTLFDQPANEWLTAAVDFQLGAADPNNPIESAALEEMRSWFPGLVARYFVAQWSIRDTDAATVVEWARRLAHIGCTHQEAKAAFEWSAFNPTDNGKKVIGRPDHFNRIVGFIQSKRRQAQLARDREQAESERRVAIRSERDSEAGEPRPPIPSIVEAARLRRQTQPETDQ